MLKQQQVLAGQTVVLRLDHIFLMTSPNIMAQAHWGMPKSQVQHKDNTQKIIHNGVDIPYLVVSLDGSYATRGWSSEFACLFTIDFVSKLTESSYLISDNDRNKLRRAKFTEEHILEIIEVAAFFNMTNRIASGTNMVPNDEYYL